jgi:hypothetical protein
MYQGIEFRKLWSDHSLEDFVKLSNEETSATDELSDTERAAAGLTQLATADAARLRIAHNKSRQKLMKMSYEKLSELAELATEAYSWKHRISCPGRSTL